MKRLGAGTALLLGIAISCAANWPSWRGPTTNGVAPEGSFPTKWSTTENVAWKVSLPGKGASTPIVWERQIFLTYGKNGKNILACLNWDGKTQWEAEVGNERSGKHRKATGSNPSAVTDGKSIFVYFKSGDLACVDFRGSTVWHVNLQKNYGEDTLWWDLGTSPVLTKDCVVVAVMHTGPSYLAGFHKESGNEVWKVERDLGAPMEAAQSYSTPVVVENAAGEQTIYVLGADHITAHRGDNGQELWRVGNLNPKQEKFFRSIASPVIIDDLIIAPYARGSSLTAVKTDGSGNVTKTNVAWFKDDLGADVPTPAAHAGRVYVCRDREELVCLDAKSGREIWRQPLERHRTQFSSSPILAGGKIYVTREDGKTFVVEQQGDTSKLVATNELNEEPVVATPVFVDGRILLRTPDHLYAIGK
jgi:outer membrane protein assembly factor BamB